MIPVYHLRGDRPVGILHQMPPEERKLVFMQDQVNDDDTFVTIRREIPVVPHSYERDYLMAQFDPDATGRELADRGAINVERIEDPSDRRVRYRWRGLEPSTDDLLFLFDLPEYEPLDF